jgi:catechol 2,3-dioxygenase-like lactoylglutathione lyase family enzyme
MSNFIHITPFMHVHDLHQALAFFNDILGFKTQFRASDYAYVDRETVAFRMLQETGPDGAPPGNHCFAC